MVLYKQKESICILKSDNISKKLHIRDLIHISGGSLDEIFWGLAPPSLAPGVYYYIVGQYWNGWLQPFTGPIIL